jgi:protein O-GlcNAc transferase
VGSRLLAFARRPAPVQVTWFGYPGTTGLSAIDYRLSDPHLDPPGETDDCYSEQTVHLPDTFWCYDPLTDDEQEASELPAQTGESFTFGCLNNFSKVNAGVLDLWAAVLREVPGSRLLLLAPAGHARDRVRAHLEREGLSGLRVGFVDRQSRQKYLHCYSRVDVALDPLPYNGHTTSLDAAWMGVPTITQIGTTVVGRAGWSILNNLGLRELAAKTPAEYVAIAARLAGNLTRLRELRATLRARLRASPLMDGKRFARHMEDAYWKMWCKWCRKGEKPK